MKKTDQRYKLSADNIDAVSAEAERILSGLKMASRERIKMRLKMEETLLFYQNKFGTESIVIFRYFSGVSKRFSLIFPGEKQEPLKNEEDEYVRDLKKLLGEIDHWKYKHQTNIVDFSIPRKPFSQLLQIGISFVCVLLFAFLSLALPQQTVVDIRDKIFSPLVNMFIGILKSTACLLIFTTITLCITNIGNIGLFKKLSKYLLSSAALFLLLSSSLAVVCFTPWINFSTEGGERSTDAFFDVFASILDIIPPDPISPFINGNAIQIIVLAILCGGICSVLGDKADTMKRFLQEFNEWITFLMTKLANTVPFLIFFVLESTFLGQDFSEIFEYKIIILLWGIGIGLQTMLNILFVCIFGRMSILDYYRQAKKPLVISLLTASSVVTLPYNIDVCKNNFKLNDNLTDLGVPIGQILFKPCSAVMMLATCVGVAYTTDQSASISWILIMILTGILLSVATPPTPGATMMVYSLLFAQMGLPVVYIGIALTLGSVTDNLVTMTNTSSLHYLLMKVSRNNRICNHNNIKNKLFQDNIDKK